MVGIVSGDPLELLLKTNGTAALAPPAGVDMLNLKGLFRDEFAQKKTKRTLNPKRG